MQYSPSDVSSPACRPAGHQHPGPMEPFLSRAGPRSHPRHAARHTATRLVWRIDLMGSGLCSPCTVPWTRLMHCYPDEVRLQHSAPSIPLISNAQGGGTAYSAYMMETAGQCPCGQLLHPQASGAQSKWQRVPLHEARLPELS